jgi:hypothetical protein
VKRRLFVLLALATALPACGLEKPLPERTERMRVTLRMPNGDPPPGLEDPALPLPTGVAELVVDVEALRLDGSLDESFGGWVRISVEPGTVVELVGDRARGRNLDLEAGVALGQLVRVRNARGHTRVWAEDIGYEPGDPLASPACANGIDDDDDGELDYPGEPGCAFANDNTETGGTHATGVSAPVHFMLPRLADVQGLGANSPYDLEGMEVETADPAKLIVTRIAADGFYATDLTETRGFGHIFAFTFNTPGGLRVCDQIEGLSGTVTEFFGFTELSFPSFDRHAWVFPTLNPDGTIAELNDGPCQVPEPVVISTQAATPDFPENPALLEPIESALVRVENVVVGEYFGPELAIGGFGPTKSNCDLDNNGLIDFDTPGSNEATCANLCADDAKCVEWTGYIARGNYRVMFPGSACSAGGGQRFCTMQVNTRAISQFDPPAMRGQVVRSFTGTLRNFSGGDLNWTIEARCSADLICDSPAAGPPQVACDEGPAEPVSSQIACVLPRTIHDPDEATN